METAQKESSNIVYGVPKDLLTKYECKHSFGEQIRIQYVLKHPEELFDKTGIVAGWSKTCRYSQTNPDYKVEEASSSSNYQTDLRRSTFKSHPL